MKHLIQVHFFVPMASIEVHSAICHVHNEKCLKAKQKKMEC